MTARLIAPVIPPSGRLAVRGPGRTGAARRLPVAAVPVIPAVPDDVRYGLGQIDESGRVADRTITSALGRQRRTPERPAQCPPPASPARPPSHRLTRVAPALRGLSSADPLPLLRAKATDKAGRKLIAEARNESAGNGIPPASPDAPPDTLIPEHTADPPGRPHVLPSFAVNTARRSRRIQDIGLA